MVIRGRVENGVVVLDGDVSLPGGTEVTVVVRPAPKATEDTMSEEQHQRLIDAFERIASLPIPTTDASPIGSHPARSTP